MTQPTEPRGQEVDPSFDGPANPNASGRQLARNFVTGYAGLVISLGLSIVITPVVLHYLGSADYGLWILILTVGGYVGLLEAGVSTAAVQMVAAAAAVHDHRRTTAVLAAAQTFFALAGVGAIVLTTAMLPLMGPVFGTGSESAGTARVALLLNGLLVALAMMTSVPQSAVFGSGRNDRSAILTVISNMVIGLAQIASVILGGGLIGLLAVTVGGSVLTYVAMLGLTRRLGLMTWGWERPGKGVFGELLRSGSRNAIVSLSSSISYTLDTVVIGVILPVREVTPYDIGLSTANFVRSAATAATGLLLPAYAHSHAVKDDERQFRLFSRAILGSLSITGPMVVMLAMFGEPLVRLWIGRVPDHTYQVLLALNIVFFAQLPGQQAYLYLTGIGRNRTLAIATLPAAVVNLVLSAAATYWFGPVGPAIGSIPQVVILEFIVFPTMACRAMHASVRRYAREALLPVLIPIGAAILGAYGLKLEFGNTSRLEAPFECIAGTVFAWLVFLPILSRTDPVVRDLLRHIRRLRHRDGTKES